MPAATSAARMPRRDGTTVVNGIRVDLIERGKGRPLLFLHPGIGIESTALS